MRHWVHWQLPTNKTRCSVYYVLRGDATGYWGIQPQLYPVPPMGYLQNREEIFGYPSLPLPSFWQLSKCTKIYIFNVNFFLNRPHPTTPLWNSWIRPYVYAVKFGRPTLRRGKNNTQSSRFHFAVSNVKVHEPRTQAICAENWWSSAMAVWISSYASGETDRRTMKILHTPPGNEVMINGCGHSMKSRKYLMVHIKRTTWHSPDKLFETNSAVFAACRPSVKKTRHYIGHVLPVTSPNAFSKFFHWHTY